MSGRPRLVQEGEPISQSIRTNSSPAGGGNHHYAHPIGHSSTITHTTIGDSLPHGLRSDDSRRLPTGSSTHLEGAAAVTVTGGGSSLQRAARNSLTKSQQHHSSLGKSSGLSTGAKSKTATSFVIGAAEDEVRSSGLPGTNLDIEHPKSTSSQHQQSTFSIERKQHFTIISSNHSATDSGDHGHDIMDDRSHTDDESGHTDPHFHDASFDMEAEPIPDGAGTSYDVNIHHDPMAMAHAHDRIYVQTPSNKTSVAVAPTVAARTQTSYVIGSTEQHGPTLAPTGTPSSAEPYDDRPLERMEGVEDLGTKLPLIVLDGANVAYAYGTALSGLDAASSLTAAATVTNNKPEPDVQGIKVATDYFVQAGLRVLVVLPQYWLQPKPRQGDPYAKMETPQLEILNDLKAKGLIVASPPTDDDDAYALTIARREEARSLKLRQGEGPGFVLSNDMFRDAQLRNGGDSALREWLKEGRHKSVGPGRISYTFGDMGTMNDRGERILDFVPNPRHPLIVWMETNHIVDGYATT